MIEKGGGGGGERERERERENSFLLSDIEDVLKRLPYWTTPSVVLEAEVAMSGVWIQSTADFLGRHPANVVLACSNSCVLGCFSE